MNIVDIADQLFRELQEPDDISIPNIIFWLQSNLNTLNLLIGTSYALDENEVVVPELGDTESAVLKYLYLIYYYGRLVKISLGAASYSWTELNEGDTTIRVVSKNEIAKSYIQLKSALELQLNRLIFSYKQGNISPNSLSAVHNLLRFYRTSP